MERTPLEINLLENRQLLIDVLEAMSNEKAISLAAYKSAKRKLRLIEVELKALRNQKRLKRLI